MRDSRVKMCLLGRFALSCDGQELPVPPGGARVLTFLGLQGAVCRDRVAWTLWQDRREERASQCLRSALWRLPRPAGTPLVVASGGELRLSAEVGLDISESRASALAFLGDDEVIPTATEELSWTTDLLPGWYDDWLVIERERYRQLRFHALERLSERATQAGQYALAISAALHVLSVDPLRESAHRCIVRTHHAEGNPAQAKEQLDAYLAELEAANLVVAVSPAMAAEFEPARAS
jgi:DNA-binding SARP family transcriptional activator